MFEKILVAIDCSSEASKLFNHALSLAQPESEILLVHFIDGKIGNSHFSINQILGNVNVPLKDSSLKLLLKEEVETVNEWLDIFVTKAKRLNISCKAECHLGDSYSGISDRAKDWNADLVVMGRKRDRAFSEVFSGRVSDYIIDRVPCPVLVIQENKMSQTKNLTVVKDAHNCLVKSLK